MSDAVKSLMPALAALSDAEKAEVRELLDPADEAAPTDADWEDAWAAEVNRRIAAVERGDDVLVPAEEVYRRLDEKFGP